jgi:hypothetical protein|tara:strand:+ start:45162 stop:45467 length:306 start_codon:yes stop_codon:yes gene_type:complete
MAQQFCVDIADSDVDRVITAMCANYNYQTEIPNPDFNPDLPIDPNTNPEKIANPETPYQFVNRMGRDFLINNTVAYELKLEKQNVPQPTPPDITDPQIPPA